ncbi:hypothetical protein DFQ26_004967 [Actinomortierella ambigua]|nr:hypothetical protein DFQ26_004967 [Actinomortierella ambigua]
MNFNMDEETARETISRMFREMDRTLNGIGDITESESEDELSDTPESSATASSSKPSTSTSPTTINQEGSPKKKSKKKKKKKTKASKPEVGDALDMEGSVDPEEVDLYDMSRSFEERIELAVTRFRKNRRFNPTRSQILSTYLDYGGIKSGQKSYQGGGLSNHPDGGEVDAEMLKAGVDLVEEPKEGQVVDFTNVATTFLGEYFLYSTGWIGHEYYVETPKVIASLLNYFLLRNVAPEYKDDIAKALEVANQASIELPIIRDVSRALPGMFSKSCSMLVEGSLHDVVVDTDHWQGPSAAGNTYGTDMDLSRRILQSLLDSDDDVNQLSVTSRSFLELEVVAVHVPEEVTPPLEAGTAAPSAATPTAKNLSGPIDIGEGEDLDTNPQLESLLDQIIQKQSQHQHSHPQPQSDSQHEAPDDKPMDSSKSNATITITTTTATTTTATDDTTSSTDEDGNWKIKEEVDEVIDITSGIANILAPPEDHWPIPKFARIEFAEWDSDLLREEQKPMSERRKFSTFLEVPIAKKLLIGMRFDAKVFKLSVGDLCYLEQASLRPTFYLAADEEEAEDGEFYW